MTEPPPDELPRSPANARAILGALIAHGVEFLVIGGLAVIAHGHVRTTRDVDVIPDPSADNMRRLVAALADLEATAIDSQGNRLPLDLSHPESLAVGNYFLDTSSGGLDLLNGARPDLKRYRRLEEAALPVDLEGHSLKVIGIDDLIRMKREAGRDKDLRDIAALAEVERAQRSG